MTIFAVIAPEYSTGWLLWMAMYIGPDVFLPIASAFAAIAGVLLMFWQKVVGLVGRILGRRPKPKE